MVLDLGKDGQFDLQNCIVESLYHFLKEVMCHKFIIHIVLILFLFVSISLFIATNICETIVWKAFSPATINTGRGKNALPV